MHNTPCFIQENRHLQLNPARLQLWACEIYNKNTTYDIPPIFPTFNAALGTLVNKNNDTQIPTIASTTSTIPVNPIIIFDNANQKYNCNNVYSKFENAFLEEEITVNAIKDLTDEQMVKLYKDID
ncbi:hypothetical protein GLOIN_2v1776024 [Rhizophagus irregularis DAOM 181602=DAOM 197198]|nr:hypothetical protein GLOIN_2v1776024 [Rhizophagus irregularis DAOM 181602=DAOM 197198]